MTPKDNHNIAQMGGLAVVEKYGKDHMRNLAKMAVRKRRKNKRLAPAKRLAAAFGAKI